MENFSVREVVEQAIRTEKLGYEFYTEMAEKFKDEKNLADLFATLAEKEVVHQRRFEELLEIIGDETPEGWEEVSEYMRAFVESEFFLASDRAVPRMKGVKTAEEAVEYALGFEKETLHYYIALKKVVMEKEIVDEIINEEQSHVMWLQRFKGRFTGAGSE
jgi:rubrerythrin